MQVHAKQQNQKRTQTHDEPVDRSTEATHNTGATETRCECAQGKRTRREHNTQDEPQQIAAQRLLSTKAQ